MGRLTPEAIQDRVVESEDITPGIKVLRVRGSEDIYYGSFDQSHLSIAQEAGIDPSNVAYAGILLFIDGPEGIELSSAGSSIEGYVYSRDEERKTFEVIAPLVKSLSDGLEFRLGKREPF